MELIEQFLKSKTTIESDCEDSIFFSDNFAVVIDGATSKSSKKYNNQTSGKMCSQLLKEGITHFLPKISAKEAVEYLSNIIFSFYQNEGSVEFLRKNPVERMSASIIIYSRYKNEIWMVGDCQCLVNEIHYTNPKKIDELLSSVRSFYIQTELVIGKSDESIQEIDFGREFILPLLKRQSFFQNSALESEFNYGVIDGFEVAEKEIKIIQAKQAQIIVLASDGYPKLFLTLIESEEYLSEIIETDPLFYKKHKSTKGIKIGNSSFDDRAYLKFKL
jgi:glycerophosphoryl diester phosphodiesterase